MAMNKAMDPVVTKPLWSKLRSDIPNKVSCGRQASFARLIRIFNDLSFLLWAEESACSLQQLVVR
jgi:hypothetical protein